MLHWLDENLEEFLLVVFLIAMTLIMGIQVLSRYVLGQSLSCSDVYKRQGCESSVTVYDESGTPLIRPVRYVL